VLDKRQFCSSFIVFVSFFAFLFATPILAQNVQVKALVNPSQIHIGDRFQYHLEVKAPESLAVDLPELVGNLGSFEVKDMKVAQGKPENGFKTHTWDLTLSTFVGGDFILPPQVVVAYKNQDSLLTRTEPVNVRVLGRLNDKDEDILDVEPPVSDPHIPWWVWALGGMVVAVGLFFGIRILIRSLRKPAPTPALPPYEEAVLALSELRKRGLLAQGNQAEHFFEAGQVLRRFVHRQFNADVLDATTAELAERLDTLSAIPDNLRKEWLQYYRETDLVKFAKANLEESACQRLETFADEFLFQNRPLSWEKDDKNVKGEKDEKKEGVA